MPKIGNICLRLLWPAKDSPKGLHGGVVVLGTSTSKMSKEQMSELLESIIAWGVENGVKFSDYTERIEEDNRGHSE
jgi:hypothetical protein